MVAYGPWVPASGYMSMARRSYWRVCRQEIENPNRFEVLEDKRGRPILFGSLASARLRANALNREAASHVAADDPETREVDLIMAHRLAEFDRLIRDVSKLRSSRIARPSPNWGDVGSITYATERLREILAHYGVVEPKV